MPQILLPQRFLVQPQYPAPLDKSVSFKGLAFAVNAALGPQDSVSGKFAATWNGSKVATPNGLSLSNSASSKTAEWDFNPVTGSNGNGTGGVTFAVIANPFAESRESCLIGVMMSGSPYKQIALYANMDGDLGSASSGMLSVEAYNNANQGFGNASGVIDGKFHVFVGVFQHGAHRVYVDGVDRTTASGVSPGPGDGTFGIDVSSRISVGSESYNSSARAINCHIPFAAAWNRAFSPAEVRALSENVWVLWHPRPRKIFDVSSGATAALSGQALAGSQGFLGVDTSVALSGQQGSLSSGVLSTAGDAIVALSGQSLSSAQGLLFPEIDVSLTGQSLSSSQGGLGVSLDAGLSGQALALSQGAIGTQGDVTVALTGIRITASQGTLSLPQAPSEGGHFAGVHVVGRKRKKRDLANHDRDEIRHHLKLQLDEAYAALFQPEIPAEIQEQAAAVIKQLKQPDGRNDNIPALQQEVFHIRQMLNLWEQQTRRQAEYQKLKRQTEEDEELLMMFL